MWAFLVNPALSHEMVPTYPKFNQSYVDGVLFTKLTLFNRRDDVQYYEIGVFDDEWNSLPFASETKIIYVKYLEKASFDVYVRVKDIDKVRVRKREW